MSNFKRLKKICPPGEIASKIRQFLREYSPEASRNSIFRLEIPLLKTDILPWGLQQDFNQKVYWCDRKDDFEMVGLGVARQISGGQPEDVSRVLHQLNHYLNPDSEFLRFYGGLSFSKRSLGEDWQDFGTYRFIIPRWELFRYHEQYFFALNLSGNEACNGQAANLIEEAARLKMNSPSIPFKQWSYTGRKDFPNKSAWPDIFNRAQEAFNQGEYEKIVLARRSDFELSESVDPMQLMAELKALSPNCFYYCFQLGKHKAFAGASPERLYERRADRIRTEAIAGTRPRGETPAEDEQQESDLLSSSKDIREHRFVADFIRDSLNDLCGPDVREDGLASLRLKSGYHLITRFRGKLLAETRDEDILEALHPTPAVGGTPTQAAVDAIEKLEPFHRGWYAAPVGYVGYREVQFAVAIRSGLLNGPRLSMYAGAGIVKESSAMTEWHEIESKIDRFKSLLTQAKEALTND